MLREAIYVTLDAFVCTAHGLCISTCRDYRIYTKEDTWDVIVPLPTDFVEEILTEGLDALPNGSELTGPVHDALVKCAVGQAAFDMDWDRGTRRSGVWQ